MSLGQVGAASLMLKVEASSEAELHELFPISDRPNGVIFRSTMSRRCCWLLVPAVQVSVSRQLPPGLQLHRRPLIQVDQERQVPQW